MPRDRPLQVAILAFPQVSASVVYGLYDLFLSAGRDWSSLVGGEPGPQLIAPRILSDHAGPFEIANGVLLTPHARLHSPPPPEVVCVPELLVMPGEPLAGRFTVEIEWLKACYARGATIATACSGAMLLAEAGLLSGQDATTHWAWCETLAKQYPDVNVHARRALVASGDAQRLVMAGGGTSWLDLALYLIARFCGVDDAMHAARVNLIDWHAVGQQPFARLARSRQVDDALIARCQTWIADNYRQAAPVAAMVKLAALPERSFKRRFRQATGMAPLEYVHTLRLEEAKQLLEATDDPIEAIANEVGYEDPGFFSRLFRRNVALTPGQYRKRFGSMRRALAGATSPIAARSRELRTAA